MDKNMGGNMQSKNNRHVEDLNSVNAANKLWDSIDNYNMEFSISEGVGYRLWEPNDHNEECPQWQLHRVYVNSSGEAYSGNLVSHGTIESVVNDWNTFIRLKVGRNGW